jgi:hypothetical protein
VICTRILAATALWGIVTAVSAADEDTRVFELRTYYATPGRLDDLHARFRDHTLRLLDKHGVTSIGYWTPLDNPEHQLMFVLAYPSTEARDKALQAFMADSEWQEAWRASEADGPLVSKVESVLLRVTDYSPQVRPQVVADRVFELRTYIASPGNLDHLHARFRDHTVKLFEKHGITNIVYWTPLEGQPGAEDKLVYFVAHRSVESAKESFDAFRADPDWVAARAASEEKAGGSLTAPGGVQSLFVRATDYSPMR